jgi:23S rRNA (adenine2503-C2)-methyltransferase
MPSLHDFAAVDAWRRRHKLDTEHLRRLRTAFYKKHAPVDAALATLPENVRGDFAAAFDLHPLRLEARYDSAHDGATKLLFRTSAGLLLESVILRMTSGRTALCVSTQVGCAARCEFCATGKMGLARNLAAAEILDQLAQANRLLAAESRSVRNVVFMGMGEPFHNEAELYQTLEILTDARAFHFHPRRLLISTVGIPDAIVRCAKAWPDVRLALSLHSARADVRRRLMPLAARYPLEELRQALAEAAAIGQHEVMIEYLLLDEVTDTDDDIAALVEYLRGIPVHVNLIPYNPIAEAPHLVGTGPERRQAFAAALKAAGFPVTTRYSLGADIAAACGQLIRDAQRGAAALS